LSTNILGKTLQKTSSQSLFMPEIQAGLWLTQVKNVGISATREMFPLCVLDKSHWAKGINWGMVGVVEVVVRVK